MTRGRQVMRNAIARGAVVLMFLFAAVAFPTALPLAWGGADAADGTRYKVSPLGLSHVLRPHQTVSPTENCRWGEPDPEGLCATRRDAPLAVLGLRLVRDVIVLAALLALMGAVGWAIPRHEWPRGRHVVPITSAVAALGAVPLFAYAVPRASQVLHDLPFGVGGTRAILQITVASAMLLGFCATSVKGRSGPVRTVVPIACAGLATAAFLLLFPAAGGLAFAAASLGIGAALGRILQRLARQPV